MDVRVSPELDKNLTHWSPLTISARTLALSSSGMSP